MSNLKLAETARWAIADSRRNVWAYDASVGTQIDDLLVPAFWLRIGMAMEGKVLPWDLLEVREETGQWYVQAVVKSIGAHGIDIAFLKGTHLENVAPAGAATPIGPEYSVKHMGTHHEWCAMRGDHTLKSGMKSQAEASRWITEYAKTASGGKP